MEETYIVIPALEPAPGLAGWVRELRARTGARVLVIDDGSGPAYQETFGQAQRVEGCTVLRHAQNMGKGRALKSGFAFVRMQLEERPCGARGARILCMDCDGQHLAEDGVRLLEKAKERPGSLILGTRDFSGAHVPWRSRIGNQISSWILKRAAGCSIGDTQTGLRAFDSSLLDLMCEVPGERFEYETEMLLACTGAGVPVLEERIGTVYVDGNGGSHFRPVRDSLQVLAVFLRRPVRFAVSSFLCAFVDLAAFACLEHLLRGREGALYGGFGRIFLATAGARILSAACNYALNRGWVFREQRPARTDSALRYLLLGMGTAAASAVCVSAVSGLLQVRPEAAKIPCDAALFFLSYQMQKKWVFAGSKREGRSDGR